MRFWRVLSVLFSLLALCLSATGIVANDWRWLALGVIYAFMASVLYRFF